MIDEIDHRLTSWIATVIDSTYEVTLSPPSINNKKPLVSVYLYDMKNAAIGSTAREIPVEITLSYLITVQSENPVESHKNLGHLLLAAKSLPDSDIEVGFPSLSPQFWQALGIFPLPHFSLSLPLAMARSVEPVPKIKTPPRIDVDSVSNITGLVLGPNEQPLQGVKVTDTHTKAVAYTDQKGLFSMATTAKSLHKFDCSVDAKGKQFSISIPMQKEHNAPIKIHLNTLEV